MKRFTIYKTIHTHRNRIACVAFLHDFCEIHFRRAISAARRRVLLNCSGRTSVSLRIAQRWGRRSSRRSSRHAVTRQDCHRRDHENQDCVLVTHFDCDLGYVAISANIYELIHVIIFVVNNCIGICVEWISLSSCNEKVAIQMIDGRIIQMRTS